MGNDITFLLTDHDKVYFLIVDKDTELVVKGSPELKDYIGEHILEVRYRCGWDGYEYEEFRN